MVEGFLLVAKGGFVKSMEVQGELKRKTLSMSLRKKTLNSRKWNLREGPDQAPTTSNKL